MQTTRSKLLAVVLCAALVGVPARASAGAASPVVGGVAALYGGVFCSYTTTITVPTTLVGGAILLVIYLLGRSSTPPPAKPNDQRHDPNHIAQLVLQQHATEIVADLSRGEGASLESFRQAAGIPEAHVPRFRAAMRAHRAELIALAQHGASDGVQAAAFVERFTAALRSDAELASDLDRALASLEGFSA